MDNVLKKTCIYVLKNFKKTDNVLKTCIYLK